MKGQGPIDSANSTTFGDLIISKVVQEPLRQSESRQSPVGLQSGPLLRRFGSMLNSPHSLAGLVASGSSLIPKSERVAPLDEIVTWSSYCLASHTGSRRTKFWRLRGSRKINLFSPKPPKG